MRARVRKRTDRREKLETREKAVTKNRERILEERATFFGELFREEKRGKKGKKEEERERDREEERGQEKKGETVRRVNFSLLFHERTRAARGKLSVR